MSRRSLFFAQTNVMFVPGDHPGLFRRFSIRPKRCVILSDGVVFDAFVEETSDGRYIGSTWSFLRTEGHLDGGVYRRYPSVVNEKNCSICGARAGQLCRGAFNRQLSSVHWVRRRLPPRKIGHR